MNKDNLMRKGLVIGIIVLFVGAGVIPSTVGVNEEKQSPNENKTSFMGFNSRGDILYVGGGGPGNYSKIQDAINDSSDGDTIFVYDDSSPYYENIVVDKAINLIGESRDTTVIDGGGIRSVIFVEGDSVCISSFSIQNSGNGGFYAGVGIGSTNNIIWGNNIINNWYGIFIDFSCNDNIIQCNNITDNRWGIYLNRSSDNRFSANNITNNWGEGLLLTGHFNNVSGNIFSKNSFGIFLMSDYNYISDNIISNNQHTGIDITASNSIISNNTISDNNKGIDVVVVCQDLTIVGNNISNNNDTGIFIFLSSKNIITRNNFINNGRNAFFERSIYYEFLFKRLLNPYYQLFHRNRWVENYWDDWVLQLPRPIKGEYRSEFLSNVTIPLIAFDRHPAQEPYNIQGGQ